MSVPRKTSRANWCGRELKQFEGGSGYLHVTLSKDGKTKSSEVHRLVAIAFIAKPDGGLEVNHKDGDKHNNAAENLEWVTRSENVKHSYLHLNRKKANHFHKVKLTESQVVAILNSEEANTKLAELFGVSDVMIGRIKRREAWRDISCR